MKKNTILIILLALFGGYSYYEKISENSEEVVESDDVEIRLIESESKNETRHIRDKNLLYDDGNEVVTMYLTVRTGNASEGTNHTWEEINTYSAYDYDEWGVDRYKVEALLQVGTEDGIPEGNLGYGKTAPNATVQVRGQTSSRNSQKNYKIELKENQGSWNGQKTIALNKHQSDGLRFRNKLGFDLLAGIDELMSLRTTFVHLYVNDLTDGDDAGFEDYGLYTQVEQLNKTALRNHGLDRYGNLYKINFFEFYRYEDVIKLATDPTYDQDLFEDYLEIKGDNDHTKLIEMLDDVNDYSIPIEEVLTKHFDEENLVYWMAFNIITGNIDTQSRNVYIYSPQNSDTWYFYAWDNDAFFAYDENIIENRVEYGGWERGVSNYWGNVLFQRCLKSDEFRARLDAAIIDLKEYMSKEKLSGMIDGYRTVTDKYVYSEPDMWYVPLTYEEYEEVAKGLPDLVEVYYQNYLDTLECPLPFFIGAPEIVDGKIRYSWGYSYDFQKEEIKYTAVVSSDLYSSDVVSSYKGSWTSFDADMLEPGEYFIKLEAEDESGNKQTAFDYYVTGESSKVYGVVNFFVNLNGTISVGEKEE